MTTIALIGGDGAGKSTVAKALMENSQLHLQYLYMGMSTRSSVHALPTSRFVYWLKKRKHREETLNVGKKSGEISASDLEYAPNLHGWVWNTARFLNRLAEANYRQLLAYVYQLQGKIVLFDRHYFFDSVPDDPASLNRSTFFFDRLLYELIDRWFPRPSLTIFLDAPPELLYSRKGEASPTYLERQREQYLKQGAKLTHFVRVDAAQPLETVVSEVQQIVEVIHTGKAASDNVPMRNL
jgi:thymidylate kinase